MSALTHHFDCNDKSPLIVLFSIRSAGQHGRVLGYVYPGAHRHVCGINELKNNTRNCIFPSMFYDSGMIIFASLPRPVSNLISNNRIRCDISKYKATNMDTS